MRSGCGATKRRRARGPRRFRRVRSETRRRRGSSSISRTNGRAAEAAEFRDIFNNEKNAWLARRVVDGMAEKNPVAAAEWAAELPEGAAQARAVAQVVRRWGVQDPRSTAAWIEQMSEGAVRDRAVTAFARITARTDPAAAAEWVLQVSDPCQRARAAEQVFSVWNARDATAAIAWFRAVPGLDAELRRQILHDYAHRMMPSHWSPDFPRAAARAFAFGGFAGGSWLAIRQRRDALLTAFPSAPARVAAGRSPKPRDRFAPRRKRSPRFSPRIRNRIVCAAALN